MGPWQPLVSCCMFVCLYVFLSNVYLNEAKAYLNVIQTWTYDAKDYSLGFMRRPQLQLELRSLNLCTERELIETKVLKEDFKF